jgi:hypothetical protein
MLYIFLPYLKKKLTKAPSLLVYPLPRQENSNLFSLFFFFFFAVLRVELRVLRC